MEILIIVLLSLVLVLGLVLLIVLLKRKGGVSTDNKELIEKSVENIMQKQMNEFNKSLGENNTQSVKNLKIKQT